MISPVFDLYSLKKQNVASAVPGSAHGAAAVGLGTSVGHEHRETEASANLSLVLTFSNILLALVLRKLGLTLDQLDTLQQAKVVEGSEQAIAQVEEKKAM
ncbi:hypothetical protein WJX81_002910 [Elliptochloris bilobata]|uniref:Uncharacterized protein n=1 Tax=Elliptochloris bilobata TaxID=381761 RepID=A0AAW1R486_9CHLO